MRDLPIPVHFFVILFVVAAGDVVQPFLIVEVPAHGFLDSFLELQGRFPAQFLLEFGGVNRVAGVVAQAVRHVGDEVHVLAFGAAEEPVDGLNHDLDDVDVLPFVEAADVVSFGDLAVMENHVDSAGMVFHEKPVAHVFALTVNRERLLVADVIDKERNQLFGELVRAVVVRAVRDNRRHAVGVVERTHKVVGAGLRCRIRGVRRVLCGLVEEVVAIGQVMFAGASRSRERGRDAFRVVHLQCTIDFVGRDVVKALAFVLFRETFPIEFRGLEQAQSSHDVRLGKRERILDGAVHVAFGGQVNDAVDLFVLHELVERVKVADVHLHELVVRLVLDILEVREVARIGKLIEVDNLVFRVLVHEQAHHVAPNEACTAGNDNVFHIITSLKTTGLVILSGAPAQSKDLLLKFKREAQILQCRVLRVLFTQQRFKAVAHRPLNANRGVVPHQATFILRVIKARALVHERRRLAENHEPVCKAFGNVELLLVLGRKGNALPLAERRTSLAQVHGHVKNFALDDAHKFALRILLLEVEPAEHALLAARFIVLHEHHVEACGTEFALVVGFHEVAADIAVNSRFNDGYTFDRCLNEIKFRHSAQFLFLSNYPKTSSV